MVRNKNKKQNVKSLLPDIKQKYGTKYKVRLADYYGDKMVVLESKGVARRKRSSRSIWAMVGNLIEEGVDFEASILTDEDRPEVFKGDVYRRVNFTYTARTPREEFEFSRKLVDPRYARSKPGESVEIQRPYSDVLALDGRGFVQCYDHFSRKNNAEEVIREIDRIDRATAECVKEFAKVVIKAGGKIT